MTYADYCKKFDEAVDLVVECMNLDATIQPTKKQIRRKKERVDIVINSIIYDQYDSPQEFMKMLEAFELPVAEARIEKCWENTFGQNPDPHGEQWESIQYEYANELRKRIRKVAKEK